MPYRFATSSEVMPSQVDHACGIRGLTNLHPTVESATTGASRLHADSRFNITYGARVMLSTPPATNASPSPALIACAAVATACRPAPRRRLTVWSATPTGRPASNPYIHVTQ